MVEEYKEDMMRAIRAAKAEQKVTYKQISDRSKDLGEFISEPTIKAVFGSNGVGHKIATLLSIADSLGIDYMALHADVKLRVENDYLKKDAEAKAAQVESMRKLVHQQSKKLTAAVTVSVVILLALCVALAFDFLQPGMGWFQ